MKLLLILSLFFLVRANVLSCDQHDCGLCVDKCLDQGRGNKYCLWGCSLAWNCDEKECQGEFPVGVDEDLIFSKMLVLMIISDGLVSDTNLLLDDLVSNMTLLDDLVSNMTLPDKLVSNMTLLDDLVSNMTLSDKLVSNMTLLDDLVSNMTLSDKLVSNMTLPDKLVSNMTRLDNLVSNMTRLDNLVSNMTRLDKLVSNMTFTDKLQPNRTFIDKSQPNRTFTDKLYAEGHRCCNCTASAPKTSCSLCCDIFETCWAGTSASGNCLCLCL
jgi:hypothetical protein